MLDSTRGIVFHKTRYGDSGAVVKIYTEKFGLQSFIVRGLFSRKSNARAALFSHLSILDLVVDRKENKPLHYIREAGLHLNLTSLSTDIGRSSLVLFINELLYRCIKEEEPNPALFDFILTVLQILNEPDVSLRTFHLLFMIKLTRYLGFSPAISKIASGGVFDMEEGLFMTSEPMHAYFISGPPAAALEQLQSAGFHRLNEIAINSTVRDELLDRLLDYYRLHVPGLGEMKSVRVLQEVLAE